MIRIIKGDIILECETQADIRLALGVLADIDVPALPNIGTVGGGSAGGGAPGWRVGGPSSEEPT